MSTTKKYLIAGCTITLIGYVLLIIYSDLAGHIPALNEYTTGEWVSFVLTTLGICIMFIPLVKKKKRNEILN